MWPVKRFGFVSRKRNLPVEQKGSVPFPEVERLIVTALEFFHGGFILDYYLGKHRLNLLFLLHYVRSCIHLMKKWARGTTTATWRMSAYVSATYVCYVSARLSKKEIILLVEMHAPVPIYGCERLSNYAGTGKRAKPACSL